MMVSSIKIILITNRKEVRLTRSPLVAYQGSVVDTWRNQIF